ncbi:MAG: acyltransferase [Candidatus Altiarchaeales archaeon HGW-Altiarchaeales-1]|nr:MAG: acyltransferase [Candidatus Altiarchaeales archaeon HGW-Altiarchaeales-1]
MSKRDKIAFEEAVACSNSSNKFTYAIKFLKNWLLERIASSFPIPSWRTKLHKMRGIKIGKDVYIGYDVIFDRIHPELITIEDYVEIGDRCIISAHSRGTSLLREFYPRTTAPVVIKKGVWIAPGCIILQGVSIGECAVIGTGAVVTKDVPSWSVAVGVPANVIKTLKNNLRL